MTDLNLKIGPMVCGLGPFSDYIAVILKVWFFQITLALQYNNARSVSLLYCCTRCSPVSLVPRFPLMSAKWSSSLLVWLRCGEQRASLPGPLVRDVHRPMMNCTGQAEQTGQLSQPGGALSFSISLPSSLCFEAPALVTFDFHERREVHMQIFTSWM